MLLPFYDNSFVYQTDLVGGSKLYEQAYKVSNQEVSLNGEAEEVRLEKSHVSNFDTDIRYKLQDALRERFPGQGFVLVEVRSGSIDFTGDAGNLMTIGYIVAGVGVATFIGGAIVDSGLSGTIEDFEDAAEAGNEAEYNSLKDDITSGQSLAVILYAAGGVLAAGGAALIILGMQDSGGDSGEAADAGDHLAFPTPTLLPSGAGIQFDWRF